MLLKVRLLLWSPHLQAFETDKITVCPVVLRAYLCTYVNLCWVMGQFIASGVLRAVLTREDQWAYRKFPTLIINA